MPPEEQKLLDDSIAAYQNSKAGGDECEIYSSLFTLHSVLEYILGLDKKDDSAPE